MKFSVVVPVYNGEKYIESSINSVLNQTYGDIELIIINDGSSDNTEEVVKSVIEKNLSKQIIYKKIENKGPSGARNAGIELANGDYICFLDSDDRYEAELFTELSKTLNGEDICFFGWEERDETTGQVLSVYEDRFKYLSKKSSGKEAALLKFRHELWLCNCNEVYSLKLIRENNILYKEGVYSGEDSNFIYKCLINAGEVISLKGNYFINIIRKDSLMHSTFSTRCLTEFDACKDLYEYAVINKFDEELCDAFFTLYYCSKLYISKRIARSLKWYQFFKFKRLCKKYIPKIKEERRLVLLPKEARELKLYKFKLLFFWVYKYYVFSKRKVK